MQTRYALIALAGTGMGGRVCRFKLDERTTPSSINLIPQFGPSFEDKNCRGICEFGGKTLKLCLPAKDSGKRPSEFKASEGGLALFVLRRSKSWDRRPGDCPLPAVLDEPSGFGYKRCTIVCAFTPDKLESRG